jgi:hypothetical protein
LALAVDDVEHRGYWIARLNRAMTLKMWKSLGLNPANRRFQ